MYAGTSTGPNWKLRFVGIALWAAIIIGACVYLRIFKPADVEAYREMARECHPVWKQFALRQFGPGDSAQRLFQRFPPTRRDEFGRYGVYAYWKGPPDSIPFSSFGVVTRDGKLLGAGAGGCTWKFTFFNTPDAELDRQHDALWQARYLKSMEQRLDQLAVVLQKFYYEQQRWPTNEGEFGTFVTGEKPTKPEDDSKGLGSITSKDLHAFRRRYGLDGPSPPFNPLGIVLNVDAAEQVCIAFKGQTDLARVLNKPGI
jgi:hypothetical protein